MHACASAYHKPAKTSPNLKLHAWATSIAAPDNKNETFLPCSVTNLSIPQTHVAGCPHLWDKYEAGRKPTSLAFLNPATTPNAQSCSTAKLYLFPVPFLAAEVGMRKNPRSPQGSPHEFLHGIDQHKDDFDEYNMGSTCRGSFLTS